MNDIEITEDATGELMVTHAEGVTEEGIDFVDGYMNAQMAVVDAGRIIIHEDALEAFVAAAKRRGLQVEAGGGRTS